MKQRHQNLYSAWSYDCTYFCGDVTAYFGQSCQQPGGFYLHLLHERYMKIASPVGKEDCIRKIDLFELVVTMNSVSIIQQGKI